MYRTRYNPFKASMLLKAIPQDYIVIVILYF